MFKRSAFRNATRKEQKNGKDRRTLRINDMRKMLQDLFINAALDVLQIEENITMKSLKCEVTSLIAEKSNH